MAYRNAERTGYFADGQASPLGPPGFGITPEGHVPSYREQPRETSGEYRRFETEMRVLARIGVGRPALQTALRDAERNGTTIEAELLAGGILRPEPYYEALAELAGVGFTSHIDPSSVHITHHFDAVLRRPRLLRTIGEDGISTFVIAPEARHFDWLTSILSSDSRRHRVVFATPATIREAAWAARGAERVAESVRGLFEDRMEMSARIVMTGQQGFFTGLAVALSLAALIANPTLSLIVLHVVLTVVFAACVTLRFAAFSSPRRRRKKLAVSQNDPGLPVYTVAVALHDEAPVARQLAHALSRLRWPRSLLDIKLICEEDDHATIDALAALDLPPEFEIVRVPPCKPLTKPKALTYALAGARGDFLVIYDAEDRPHPDQLLEAWSRFSADDGRLACIQAPLVISNGGANVMTAGFAFEYAALFRGLLPFLASQRLPFPLGGTSNHFRVSALRETGAWDPHNVTEDADLGMRLARAGYRLDVITRQTIEDAPLRFGPWLRQRTRWYKGWLQTWLVLMRRPGRLRNELGSVPFVTVQLLVGGLIASALAHPLMLYFIGSAVLNPTPPASAAWLHHTLFVTDVFNIAGSYLAHILLGRHAMTKEERKMVGWRWLLTPVYWLSMSLAAWLALFELQHKPFFWAKTPHKPIDPA